MTKILFTGPVGSGKSTQAELLAKSLNIPLFQSGQITRELAKENSPLGGKIKGIMKKGLLIDDQTIAQAIKQSMAKVDTSGGFIFDGFPRSLEQLRVFDPVFDVVFNFKISNRAILDRLVKRQRVDDTPEAINIRLKIYSQQTRPLVEHYNNLGILHEINATGSVGDIQRRIKEGLRQISGQIA